MRLPRTDLIAVLTIIAGGAIGASVTFAPLLLFGPSDNLAPPVQAVRPPAKAAPAAPRAAPVWSPDGTTVLFEDRNGNAYRVRAGGGEPLRFVVSPDGEWIAYQSDQTGEPRILLRMIDSEDGTVPVVLSRNGSLWLGGDGDLDADDIESIEVLKGESAVERFGEDASAGVIRIRLKEPR